MEHNVETAGGSVKNTENMGKRRLAYMVRKFNEGFFVLMHSKAKARWSPKSSVACASPSR